MVGLGVYVKAGGGLGDVYCRSQRLRWMEPKPAGAVALPVDLRGDWLMRAEG